MITTKYNIQIFALIDMLMKLNQIIRNYTTFTFIFIECVKITINRRGKLTLIFICIAFVALIITLNRQLVNH